MTTELSQLPTNPSVPSNANTNSIVGENNTMYSSGDLDKTPPKSVSFQDNSSGNNDSMNNMLKQVQEASQQGLTNLNSVQTNNNIPINDAQSTANFVPQQQQQQAPLQQNTDYIQNHVSSENVDEYNKSLEKQQSVVDCMFNDMKIPIIVALLYYIFEMPSLKNYIFKLFPKFFKNDSNLTTIGMAFKSILFSSVYYSVVKLYNILI